MGRIRTIKPEFFLHEGLFDLEAKTGYPIRVIFAGLWTQADREGRFLWRPRRLKAAIAPYDGLDFGAVLDELVTAGFVSKYEKDNETYAHIPTWDRHQVINNRERASVLPAPPRKGKERKGKEGKGRAPRVVDASGTRDPRVEEIRLAYIRKKAPKDARIAIAAAVERIGTREGRDGHAWLLSITRQYSAAVEQWSKEERGPNDKFVPYPATWFNGERYDEAPETWASEKQARAASAVPRRGKCANLDCESPMTAGSPCPKCGGTAMLG